MQGMGYQAKQFPCFTLGGVGGVCRLLKLLHTS